MKKWITKSGITVIRLDGIKCNCFVIDDGNETWLVDTSKNSDRERIVNQLESNGIKKLTGIVLTHSHTYHVEGAAWFVEHYACPVYIHDSELHFIHTGDSVMPKAVSKALEPIEKMVNLFTPISKYPPCRDAKAIPFATPLFANEKIQVIETPGHSEGCVSICIDDEIALVGDAMRRRTWYSVFLPWANQPGLITVSWKKLLEQNCDIYIPSHGKEITKDMLTKELNS